MAVVTPLKEEKAYLHILLGAFEGRVGYLLMISDASESFLSSQSHRPFESESSKIFSSRARVMTWSSQSRVTRTVSHFESMVCKLESMSSHMKFHVFPTTFFCYQMAPNMP